MASPLVPVSGNRHHAPPASSTNPATSGSPPLPLRDSPPPRLIDVVQLMTITMSRPSTLHKSPWTSKVSSFLYLSPFPHPLDGMLRHASSLDDARVTTTSTCTREDGQGTRGLEAIKAVAWKRRRKKTERRLKKVAKTKRQDEGEKGGTGSSAGPTAGLNRPPGRTTSRYGRPPSRPRPAPGPGHLPTRLALDRIQGQATDRAGRPPARHKHDPGPDHPQLVRDPTCHTPVLYPDYK